MSDQSKSDLYLFAMGGTGARVVRSLIMLLACGVPVNVKRIIPIFIDPDMQNGDTLRTLELLNTYRIIQQKLKLKDSKSAFFQTEIATLKDLDNSGRIGDNSFRLSFGAGGIRKTFEQFLDFNTLTYPTQKLTKLFFSEDNLSKKLDVGFRGSPNIGTIVLNSVRETDEWKFFGDNFNKNTGDGGDRIFIISSIFGGTGASGFPLLLENLRAGKFETNSLNKAHDIKSSVIGALSVLPYFEVQADEASAINSSAFVTKTREALLYYNEGLSHLNALYYIGDTQKKQYKNSEGGLEQKNDAHVIELLGATAPIHFLDTPTIDFGNDENCYNFAIDKDVPVLTFEHFSNTTKRRIYQPMIQFHYFAKYFKDVLPKHFSKDFARKPDIAPVGDTLQNQYNNKNGDFYPHLHKFIDAYHTYIKELTENERKFAPFAERTENDWHVLVKDKTIKKTVFASGLSDNIFADVFNTTSNVLPTSSKEECRFMEIMQFGIKKIVEDKIMK